MSLRTFNGNTFGGWSFRNNRGGTPSRALTSSLRQSGAAHLFAHNCDIERATRTNVDGETVRTWAVEATDVPCLVQEKNGGTVRAKDGRMLAYDATAYLPIDTDIRPNGAYDLPDRLIWTDIEPNVVFMVVFAGDTSGMLDHLKVYLKRLPDPAGTED